MIALVLNLSWECSDYPICVAAYASFVKVGAEQIEELIKEVNPILPSSFFADKNEANKHISFLKLMNYIIEVSEKVNVSAVFTNNKKKLKRILLYYYSTFFPKKKRRFLRNEFLFNKYVFEKRIYTNSIKSSEFPAHYAADIIAGKKISSLLQGAKLEEENEYTKIIFSDRSIFVVEPTNIRFSAIFPFMKPEPTIDEETEIFLANEAERKLQKPQEQKPQKQEKTQEQTETEKKLEPKSEIEINNTNATEKTESAESNDLLDLPDITISDKITEEEDTQEDTQPLSTSNTSSDKEERRGLTPALKEGDDALKSCQASPPPPPNISFREASVRLFSPIFSVMSYYTNIPIISFLGWKTKLEKEFFFPFCVDYLSVPPYDESYYKVVLRIQSGRLILKNPDLDLLWKGYSLLKEKVSSEFSINLTIQEKKRIYVMLVFASVILRAIRENFDSQQQLVEQQEEFLNNYYARLPAFGVEESFAEFFYTADGFSSLSRKRFFDFYSDLLSDFRASYSFLLPSSIFDKIVSKYDGEFWTEEIQKTENVFAVYYKMVRETFLVEEQGERKDEIIRFFNDFEEKFSQVFEEPLYPYNFLFVKQ